MFAMKTFSSLLTSYSNDYSVFVEVDSPNGNIPEVVDDDSDLEDDGNSMLMMEAIANGTGAVDTKNNNIDMYTTRTPSSGSGDCGKADVDDSSTAAASDCSSSNHTETSTTSTATQNSSESSDTNHNDNDDSILSPSPSPSPSDSSDSSDAAPTPLSIDETNLGSNVKITESTSLGDAEQTVTIREATESAMFDAEEKEESTTVTLEDVPSIALREVSNGIAEAVFVEDEAQHPMVGPFFFACTRTDTILEVVAEPTQEEEVPPTIPTALLAGEVSRKEAKVRILSGDKADSTPDGNIEEYKEKEVSFVEEAGATDLMVVDEGAGAESKEEKGDKKELKKEAVIVASVATTVRDSRQEAETEKQMVLGEENIVGAQAKETIPLYAEVNHEEKTEKAKAETPLAKEQTTKHETETMRETEKWVIVGTQEEAKTGAESEGKVKTERQGIVDVSTTEVEAKSKTNEEENTTLAEAKAERNSEANMEAEHEIEIETEGTSVEGEPRAETAVKSMVKEEAIATAAGTKGEVGTTENMEAEEKVMNRERKAQDGTKAKLETGADIETKENVDATKVDAEKIQTNAICDPEKEASVAAGKTEDGGKENTETEGKGDVEGETTVTEAHADAEAKVKEAVTARTGFKPKGMTEAESLVKEKAAAVKEKMLQSPLERGEKQLGNKEESSRLESSHVKVTSEGNNEKRISAQKENETERLSLAQRMKQMFDSASPDEPSTAFGKNTKQSFSQNACEKNKARNECDAFDMIPNRGGSSTSSSLAKNMKKMFDSPSPEEPSMAFGLRSRTSGQMLRPVIADSKQDRRDETKQFENRKASEEDRPKPPPDTKEVDVSVSVASQMASLLFVSSVPKKKMHTSYVNENVRQSAKNPVEESRTQDSIVDDDQMNDGEEEHSVNRGTVVKSQLDEDGEEQTVVCDTEVETEHEKCEEIEEITVHECSEGINFRDDDEFVEEIIIEDDHDDGFSVSSAGKFFENTACIELSTEFLTGVDNEDINGDLYDEITADNWEFEETTVDDSAVLDEKQDMEGPMEGSKKDISKVTIAGDNLDHNKEIRPLPTNTAPLKRRKDAKVELKGNSEVVRVANFIPTKETAKSPLKTIEPSVGFRRTGKENSTSGRFAEKMRMFDPPRVTANERRQTTSRQSWKKPKTITESAFDTGNKNDEHKSEEGRIEKASAVYPATDPKAQLIIHPCRKIESRSGTIEKDKSLADEIVLLVKEPGAMANKRLLAERITFLLIGADTNETKAWTTKSSSHSAPSNISGQTSSKNTHQAEADAYLSRKKDGFRDPGLKQMRGNAVVQKEKLRHVSDPDTISIRNMKRISISQLNEDQSMPTSVQQAFSFEHKTIAPSSPCMEDKNALAERVIARIWSDGGKPKSKPWSTSPASMSSEKQKTPSPRKLGDRLKMFESPSSSSSPRSDSLSDKSNSVHSRGGGRIERAGGAPKALSFENTKKSSESVSGRGVSNKVGKKTSKSLSAFQRMWRKTRSKTKNDPTAQAAVTPKKNATFPASPCGVKHRNIGTQNTNATPTLLDSGDGKISTPMKQQHTESVTRDASPASLYRLEDFEQGRFDKTIVDMEKWEEFLLEDEFVKHFGVSKDEFYQQPKWKRDTLRRKIRVAF